MLRRKTSHRTEAAAVVIEVFVAYLLLKPAYKGR